MKTLFARVLFVAVLVLAGLAQAQVRSTRLMLLNGVTSVAAGSAVNGISGGKTYQASGSTSSGTGSATVLVQCSNDSTNWDTLGTITLTLGTSSTSNSFASDDRCAYVRGNVTALTGTGATVSLIAGF